MAATTITAYTAAKRACRSQIAFTDLSRSGAAPPVAAGVSGLVESTKAAFPSAV